METGPLFWVTIFTFSAASLFSAADSLTHTTSVTNQEFDKIFNFTVKPGENTTFKFHVGDLGISPGKDPVYNLQFGTGESDLGFVTATVTMKDKKTVILANNNFDLEKREKNSSQDDLWPVSSQHFFCFGDAPLQKNFLTASVDDDDDKNDIIIVNFNANFICLWPEVHVRAQLSTTSFPRMELNREYELNLQPGQLNLFHVDTLVSAQDELTNDNKYLATKFYSSSSSCKTVVFHPGARCPSIDPRTKSYTSVWNDQNKFRVDMNDSIYENGLVLGVILGGDEWGTVPCPTPVGSKTFPNFNKEENAFIKIYQYQPRNQTSQEISSTENYARFSSFMMVLLIVSCFGVMAWLVAH